MMGKNYYYFLAGLPEISVDDRKLSLNTQEFRQQAKELLDKKTVDVVELFFLTADNAQIVRLLQKKEADDTLDTVFPLDVLEAEIEEDSGKLPVYIRNFIREYKAENPEAVENPGLRLTGMYYDFLLAHPNRFIREYFEFSLNIKNLITALNCRKHRCDISREIIGKNSFAESLRTSNLRDFGLEDYDYVDKVIQLMGETNLVERERKLDMMIWDFIDTRITFKYFRLENIVVFLICLSIVERWIGMKSETGRRIFTEMVERFRTSFRFGEEFR